MSKGSGGIRSTNSRTIHNIHGSCNSKSPDFVTPTSLKDIGSGKVIITEKDARNMSPIAINKTLDSVTERIHVLDRKRERNATISLSEQRLIETRTLLRKALNKRATN